MSTWEVSHEIRLDFRRQKDFYSYNVDAHSPLTVNVSSSVREIDPKEWRAVFSSAPEEYFLFKTMEETLREQFKFCYISLYENSRIVCLAPCFITDYALDTSLGSFLKTWASRVKKLFPHLFTVRVLICGSPIDAGRIGTSNPPHPDTVNILAGTLHSIGRQEHIRLLAFKDFPKHQAALFEPLQGRGFHKVPSYPACSLDVRFRSFEEYLASFSSATRKDLKRKFKKVDGQIHLEMEVGSGPGNLLDQIHRLYLNTLEKSDAPFERITKKFFERIAIDMPEETKYFLWRIDGRLVAFDLCLVSGSTLADKYIGMDYEAAYQYHLYYVTFRDVLSWCIQNGIRTYSTGTLNYDPKKRLDFTFVPQDLYFKHMNRAMNFLLGPLSGLLKPENFDPLLKSLTKKSTQQ